MIANVLLFVAGMVAGVVVLYALAVIWLLRGGKW